MQATDTNGNDRGRRWLRVSLVGGSVTLGPLLSGWLAGRQVDAQWVLAQAQFRSVCDGRGFAIEGGVEGTLQEFVSFSELIASSGEVDTPLPFIMLRAILPWPWCSSRGAFC
jgi:hypothetical protein